MMDPRLLRHPFGFLELTEERDEEGLAAYYAEKYFQSQAGNDRHGYLRDNPETIVALAHFDFDIYAPTKACLQASLPYLPRGAFLAFDELNCPEFAGETIALREVLGMSRYAIRRQPNSPLTSWLVIE